MLRTADHLSALWSGKGIQCRASELKYTPRKSCNEKCNRVVFFYFIYYYFYFFSGHRQKIAKDCWRETILLGGILPVSTEYVFDREDTTRKSSMQPSPLNQTLSFSFHFFLSSILQFVKETKQTEKEKKAPAFENLFSIERRKKTYYCIFKTRQKLFSRTDGFTLMIWIKLLSIVASPASEEGTGKFGEKLSLGMPKPFLTNQ